MINYLTVPGLGNSSAEHWQSQWENSNDNFFRVQQKEWDEPNCQDWVANIDLAVAQFDAESVILVAHSIGCLAVAHWAQTHKRNIRGALLVAPCDINNPPKSFTSTGFSPVPTDPLDFQTIVIASANDPWVSLQKAKEFARNWGSNFINIGNAGHIYAASGYGDWEAGLDILKRM